MDNKCQLLVKETCKRDIRNKLFSIDFAICWIECCIVVSRIYVLFKAYRRTVGRTDRAALIAASPVCIRTLKALTGLGNLWMSIQLLCSQQSRNFQTPSRNISSNCLTWCTWLASGRIVVCVFSADSKKCLLRKVKWLISVVEFTSIQCCCRVTLMFVSTQKLTDAVRPYLESQLPDWSLA
jgi:hypothetical protein